MQRPWLALAAIEALAFGVFGVLAVAVGRAPPFPGVDCGVHGSPPKHFVAEFRSAVSPWGRLAFGQADSPLLPLASIAGAPGLSFVTALTGTLIAWSLARTLPCSMASIGEGWRCRRPHLCECIGDKFSRCRP